MNWDAGYVQLAVDDDPNQLSWEWQSTTSSPATSSIRSTPSGLIFLSSFLDDFYYISHQARSGLMREVSTELEKKLESRQKDRPITVTSTSQVPLLIRIKSRCTPKNPTKFNWIMEGLRTKGSSTCNPVSSGSIPSPCRHHLQPRRRGGWGGEEAAEGQHQLAGVRYWMYQ